MEGLASEPIAGSVEEGKGSTPRLELDGFSGPLDLLLALARAHQVELARLPLRALMDQLAAALDQAAPLSRKAAWVAMAAWLMLLRARLLLPPEAPARQAAEAEAGRLRGQLAGLREMQALAAWLERRPQLGRDVFARGQPEPLGTAIGTSYEVDVIEFLWDSLALFDDSADKVEAASLFRPRSLALYSVAEAQERILRRLAEMPEDAWLGRLLPQMAAVAEATPEVALRRRSAWANTLVASLELARQGSVTLAQEAAFQPIQVCPVAPEL